MSQPGLQPFWRETILSISWNKQRLGLASYNPDLNEIGYAEVNEEEDFLLLQMFIQELHPSSIIIASNSQEQLKIALEKNLSGVEYRVISVASGMFSEECARRYISMLRAGNVPATSSRPLLVGAASLSLVFDFSKQQVTKAVGALLSYLHKNPIIGAEVNLNEGTIIVESFSQIDLSKIVTMDGSAFSALQIFQTERHPSMHGIGIQKEGMSLFSLMDNTSSQPGAKMLKQWFHRPICDKACINNRLNTIEFFLKSLGPEVMRDLSVIISQVKPLNHILLSLKKGSNTMNQYESLLKTILNCCAAIETLSSFTLYDPSLTKKYPILDDVASFPTSTLNELANRIFGTIDFDGKMEPSSENKQQNEVFESDNNEVFSDSNSSNSLTQEKRTKLSRNPETDEEMENESFGRINDRKTQSGLFHDDFEKRSNLLDAYSSQSSIFGPLHKKRFQESVFHPYRITSPLLIPFGDDDDDNSYFSDFDNEVKPFESFGNTKTAFISEGMQSFDAYRSFPFKDKERNFRENKEILDKSNVKNKLDTQKIKELKKQNIISSKRKKGIIMKDEQSGNEKVKANENDEIMEDDNYPKGNEFQSKEVAVPKGDEARVRRGINSTLDRLKETYSSLADLMSNVAKEEIESMPKGLIHRLSVAFFPNLGYLIAIHLKEFSGFEDIQTEHLSQEEDYTRTTFQLSQSRRDELALIEKQCGLTYQFEIDATRYYKSRRMKEMDLTLGDITEQIADEERKVFTDLKLKIDDCTDILIKAVDIIAEVDCYISFAVSAYEYHLTRPQIVDEPELTISEGRNLLQELCVPFFVPNDTHLKGDKPEAILLITGPNSSGKTVYLKQVAQIVFLAHIGSFVPAKAATIGLVDHIFCRIVTTESVSTPLSSFMIDSMQMSTMMQNASRHSLLLIDEYGKGTNHIDGVSLLSSCIQFFIEQKENCPLILINTHFPDLFDEEMIPQSSLMSFCTMQFHLSHNNSQSKFLSMQHSPQLPYSIPFSDISFSYRLIPGKTTESFSLFCAKLAGVSKKVIDRAQKFLLTKEKGIELNMNDNEECPSVNSSVQFPSSLNSQLFFPSRVEAALKLFLSFDVEAGDLDEFVGSLNAI